MKKKIIALLSASLLCVMPAISQPKVIELKADKPVGTISPTMWGLFFEDINFAADGGIYAELVKNRSFEFDKPLMGWEKLGQEHAAQFQLLNSGNENNSRFLRIETGQEKELSLANEGFRGMGLKAGETYRFSLMTRQNSGASSINIELLDDKGNCIGHSAIDGFSPEWKHSETAVLCSKTVEKGRLKVTFRGAGTIDVDMISLFPENTWKGRKNGLRADLVQKLADLKPGFLRFPGGCIVEGMVLENRYQWKKTVGNPNERKLIVNRWNMEFAHRATPDYFQSYGLGFYEYFLLAEDIGAEPLPILNCGMACQYNSGELAAAEDLEPYIQDILDLIAFANDDASTPWGKVRAEMGHPEPFHLKMVGVGNEQWGRQYIERLEKILPLLKAKYPGIAYVGGAGPSSDGKEFDYLWKEMRRLDVPLVDEHYYKTPEWFMQNAARYDHYNRQGPKVFAGEYAAHDKEGADAESRNTWKSALAEAALMTGLERNADVVRMASYAPLFGHVGAWQWRPDMIWFDNLRSVATPNYWVQKLFSTNSGNQIIAALLDGKPLAGQDSLYVSSCFDHQTSEIIVKLVNGSAGPQKLYLSLNGRLPSAKAAKTITLSASDLALYNTLDAPDTIIPVDGTVAISGKKVELNVEGYSFTVVRIPVK